MSKGKEFAKNTTVLLIGKFSTQFVSLLLIPLYTNYLITSDYGTVDLIQTYIGLFVPILTLKLDSVAFRYLIDVRNQIEEQKKVITNIISVLVISIAIFSLIYLVLHIYINFIYDIWVFLDIIIVMISSIFLQFLRGLGENTKYAIVSILTTIVNVTVNLVLIIGFEFNAKSIFIASILSNVIASIYILKKINLIKLIDFKLIDFSYIKELFKYSIPMIPNSLSWWIVNVSDRTIISGFLGIALNGIYTVSCKFSNLINNIFTIFNMSWQETASLYIEDKDNKIFFNNMINRIFILFAVIGIELIAGISIFFNIVVGERYYDSYNYIPILILGNIIYIFLSLLGGIYVAKKLVKQVANTTTVSAIINIIINLLLVRKFGLYAAAFSTLIAYIVLAIYRYYDVQKIIKIKLDLNKTISILFLYIMAISAYYCNVILIKWIVLIMITIIGIVLNRYMLIDGINILKKRFKCKSTKTT